MENDKIESEESVDLNLFKFIIQRFELNDVNDPNCYIVGFNVCCNLNQRESYIETTVDYKDGLDKGDNEICVMAYNKLKPRIIDLTKGILKKKFIVGSEFVPADQ